MTLSPRAVDLLWRLRLSSAAAFSNGDLRSLGGSRQLGAVLVKAGVLHYDRGTKTYTLTTLGLETDPHLAALEPHQRIFFDHLCEISANERDGWVSAEQVKRSVHCPRDLDRLGRFYTVVGTGRILGALGRRGFAQVTWSEAIYANLYRPELQR